MNFTFTGELSFNALESEHPFIRTGKTKSKKNPKPYKSLNLIVVAAKNNRAYTEIFGMERDEIKTKLATGDDATIAWEDRLDADVIKSVNSMRKFSIVDGEEYHDFITELDFIDYIEAHVDELNGRRAIVRGSVSKSDYKGKVMTKYTLNKIILLDEDDTKHKNGLRVSGVMFWNKEGIDVADWKESKKITITAYTNEYIGKDEDSDERIYKYREQQVIFDASKLDFTNEHHVKLLALKLSQLGCQYDAENDKVKVVLKKNWVAHNLILSYVNGQEEVELTYDDLTDIQKAFVDLGEKEVKDFAPKGGTFGEKTTIYKVVDFNLNGDYNEGYVVQDDDTSDEIEENIYVPAPYTESTDELEEEEEKPKKAKKAPAVEEDDDEDLFA